jgi:hypothetical protein
VYISSISNHQNINSKAKLSLISERNLLPKGAVQKLAEKAKKVGNPEDTISIAICKDVWLDNNKQVQTIIRIGFLGIVSSILTHYKEMTVSGSFRERQKQAFKVIDEYIENFKK